MSEYLKNNRGSILVMSVLIMSMVVTISITVGTIVLNQMQQAKNFDYSILAYYAADSAAESALYKLRKLNATPAELDGQSGSFDNSAEWERAVAGTLNLYVTLATSTPLALDLYDAEDNCGQVKCVKFIWDRLDGEGFNPDLEVTYYAINTLGGLQIIPEQGRQELHDFDLQQVETGDQAIATNQFTLQDNTCYSMKIKPLYDSAAVHILSYSDAACNNQVGIPSYLTINSLGKYKGSQQRINTIVLRKPPLSSIFEYVLFSEGDIIK